VQVFELLDHCKLLNGEVDDLQREVFALRRKVCPCSHSHSQQAADGEVDDLQQVVALGRKRYVSSH
jgi:hypothetical protein